MNNGIQAISNQAGIRASTPPRLQAFKIGLENESRVGTPIRRNLMFCVSAQAKYFLIKFICLKESIVFKMFTDLVQ